MQPRSITNPNSPPNPGSSIGKPPPRQKTYYIPPPPPPTKFPLRYPQVPIYPSTNNTYDPGFTSKHLRSWPSTSSTSSSSTTLTCGPPSTPPNEPPGTQTSRYIHMLLSIDTIPKIYNLLAAFSTWILLAGYVLLPGTFTSLQNLPPPPSTLDPSDPNYDPSDRPSAVEAWILERVRNTPLLYLATACSALGVLGMCLLWLKWRRNYVWILNRIFLPGMLNSLAGVISTVVNVHTAQQGRYSLTAVVTVVVTACSAAVNGGLWLVYNYWALRRVQEMHRREYFEKGRGGEGNGDGLVGHTSSV